MKIIIAGHGKMAKLFFLELQKDRHQVLSLEEWLPESRVEAGNHEMVALHVGSGAQLSMLIGSCMLNRIPILNGSTGQQFKDNCPVPLINAENFALPILRIIQLLPEFAQKLNILDYSLSRGIVETHQSTKKTVPGTAKRMAEAVGVEVKDIISIRDKPTQLALGVPPESLDGHGYHWINWEGTGVHIQLRTMVHGRHAYYVGGLHLLTELHRRKKTPNGVHDVLKFLKW